MKAIVVELKNDFAAVLSDDGCITTVKNKNYEVGQTIQLSKAGAHLYFQLHRKICVFAASAVAATVILATGTWAYASPYTYVSLDINPSIEYTVNRFDRVLKIKAMNDDGEELLHGTDFVNKSISTAFSATIEQLTEAGYLNDKADNGIVIATSSENKDKAEELAADLQEIAEKHINEDGNSTEVEAFSVDSTLMDEAKELGVTPGKLNLIEKLKDAAASSDSVNMEEWFEKSVNEIKKATKSYKASGEKVQKSRNDTDTNSEDENSASDTTVEEANTRNNHDSNDLRDDNNNSENSGKKSNSHNEGNNEKYENSVQRQKDLTDNANEHNDKASKTERKQKESSNVSSNNPSSSVTDNNSTSDKKDTLIDNDDDAVSGNEKNMKDNDANEAKEITEPPATITGVPSSDSTSSGDERIDESGNKSTDSKESEPKDNDSQSADPGNGNGDTEKSDHKSSE
jgi:hypothetical protein